MIPSLINNRGNTICLHMCDLPIPGLYGAQAAQASIAEGVSTGQVEALSANSADGRAKFYLLVLVQY